MTYDLDKLYKTRDGRQARIFMLDNGAATALGAVNTHGLWKPCAWINNGVCIGEATSADLVGEWVEPKAKVVLTEFLCWHNYEAFPQTRWAKSKENAEKFCSDNGYKLLQWGLRTVEDEEG